VHLGHGVDARSVKAINVFAFEFSIETANTRTPVDDADDPVDLNSPAH
jgi:hypothetical protein